MNNWGALRALAAGAAVWVGATGAPLPFFLSLLWAAPAAFAWAVPRSGGIGRVAVQASAAVLLLRSAVGLAGVPVLCASLILCAVMLRSRLEARVILGLSWLEAARLRLLAASVAASSVSLTWLGLVGSAATAFGRSQGAWVAVGWLVLGLRGHQRVAVPLEGASQAGTLARAGLLDGGEPALRNSPSLGLTVLGHMQETELALDLLPVYGARHLLWAGWHPMLDAVPPRHRPATVRALDDLGRGGEALRLARQGAAEDRELAWWAAVLAREQQQSPPPYAPRLPGVPVLDHAVELNWTFYTEETRVQPLHLPPGLQGLRLETEGQHHEGAPELRVSACGVTWQVPVPQGADEVVLPHALSSGPCRLRISMVGDRVGPMGDRNAVVRAVSGDRRAGQVRREK